jgi:large subunit ribosomal protein L7e
MTQAHAFVSCFRGKGQRAIPESIRKKAARDADLAKKQADKRAEVKAARTAVRKEQATRAAKYAVEMAAADAKLIADKRAAKAAGNFFVESEGKFCLNSNLFNSINKLAPKPKKIMQLLRLRQLHNGVFIRLNKATINMIRMVEPFVTYGYPTSTIIKKLIYKRGYGKLNRSRIPLTDNIIVERALGKLGVNCIEDVVHEIQTCGPNFKAVNNFLWPFKLNSPHKGFEKKRHPYANGGVFGNRENLINELITRMM